ncbi:MAG: response regulator [Gemmatimonadota bacterium]|nr:response regulator [Gemmatimonadota bacterium]
MVVDDEPQNVRYVIDVLEWAGYANLEGLTDPLEAIARFPDYEPDLVILDLLMPGMDGFGVMEAMLDTVGDDAYLPFLILTSDITSESRRRALSSGARDFLTKPMSPTEVRLRVDNLLETRFLYLECARQAVLLGGDTEPAEPAPSPVDEPSYELLERWGKSIDASLPGAEGRSKRISWLAARLAEAMDLPDSTIDTVRGAALLHGLGSRRNPLSGSDDPRRSVHADPEAGARLLDGTAIPLLTAARRMLLALDEHWDGSGRTGLRGEAIPIEGRIVAVALAYDDAESDGCDPEEATARVESLAGSRFDPAVVEVLAHAHAVGA